MSGRKSTEVANVLAQGQAVRKLTDNDFFTRIESMERRIKDASITAAECRRSCKKELAVSPEAQQVFGDQARNQIQAASALLRDMPDLKEIEAQAAQVRSALDKVEQRLREADSEAAAIRAAIQRKYDYCTPEYRAAQKVVSIYQECRREQQRILREMSALEDKARTASGEAKAKANQWQGISRQIQEYDRLGKEKLKADEQKKKLLEALSAIPVDIAQKFLPDEYSKLTEDIQRLQGASDQAVVATFQDAFGKIGIYHANLTEKHEEWKRQKSESEDLLANVESMVESGYIGPIAYYNEGDKAQRTGLFDYMEEYTGNKEYRRSFDAAVASAKKEIYQENFTRASAILREQHKAIASAQQDALTLQENMLKKAELAGAIQDVMDELHYDTNLEIIDDNPAHGFRLICQVGDEIIDFDRIDINDDGKVIIDVDHTEPRTGACKESWKSITHAMRTAGVPLTDVKKNGMSILAPSSQGGDQGKDTIRERSK